MKEFLTKNIWFCLMVVAIFIFVIVHDLRGNGLDVTEFFEILLFLITFEAFYFLFAREGSKFNNFYRVNSFYCKLMILTVAGIIIGNTHFLQDGTYSKNDAVKGVVKVWEVAAYSVTCIYTAWFWKWGNGTKILDEINSWKPATNIILAVVLLFFITLIHFIIIFGDVPVKSEYFDWVKPFTGLLSIGLIAAVYVLFLYINKSVIDNCDVELYKREFTGALKYIDRPTLIIFCILFLYAVYITVIDVSTSTLYAADNYFHSIEIFFSGAIAFELLLSSIIWANTETV